MVGVGENEHGTRQARRSGNGGITLAAYISKL